MPDIKDLNNTEGHKVWKSYSYNYTTGNVTVDLGDFGVGEPDEEIPEEMEEKIPTPETTIIETITPVIPEEPYVPGVPVVIPDAEEEGCASIPKPKYNYTYSYDTSYSTSYSYVEQADGSSYKYNYSYPVYNDIITDDYEDEYDMGIPIEGDSCPCELSSEAADISVQIQDAVQAQAVADAMIIAKQEKEIEAFEKTPESAEMDVPTSKSLQEKVAAPEEVAEEDMNSSPMMDEMPEPIEKGVQEPIKEEVQEPLAAAAA